MNAKQTQAAQTVTQIGWLKRNAVSYIPGEMTFSLMDFGDTVLVHGSNTDTTKWFEKQVIVQVTIGPRGGINKIKVH